VSHGAHASRLPGPLFVPSPLAQGPAEPLIEAHFQIDRSGRVTLPTINDQVRELNDFDIADQRSMRASLTSAAPELLRAGTPALQALQARFPARPRLAANPPPQEPKEQIEQKAQKVSVQKLDPNAFLQNINSNEVYTELKSANRAASKPIVAPPRAPEVEIGTSDFAWNMVDVGGQHALAALRPVVTPEGSFVQGFLVSTAGLMDALKGAKFLRLVDLLTELDPSWTEWDQPSEPKE